MRPCLFATFLLLTPLLALASKSITKTQQDYVFNHSLGYQEYYSETGFVLDNHTLNTFIFGVEKLENHEVLLWNGKKWKPQAKKDSYESDFNRGFYSGHKVIRTLITGPNKYAIRWEKKCDYEIYCSTVDFNPKADTSVVSLLIPDHLQLVIHWSDTADCDTIIYSSLEKEHGILHTFTHFKQEKENTPAIRILVRDTSHLTHTQSFCRSYLRLIEPVLKEVTPASDWIDSLQLSSAKEEEKVEAVFNYAQNQISYLQITNGLEGLCPRPVSYTLHQKQGDCKAMALLVHKYLDYLNIPNQLAISASIDYQFELNFPTVSSGNHMVCVYLPNPDEMIILDPTDKYCEFPQPSRHTQNTSVLLLDYENPEFKDIPSITSSTPSSIAIELSSETRKGRIDYSPEGAFKWLDNELSQSTTVTTTHLKKSIAMENALLSDVTLTSNNSYTGKINVSRTYFLSLNGNLLINQSFLPCPDDLLPVNESYIYHPANHTYHVQIQLPKSYQMDSDYFTQLDTDVYFYSYKTFISEDHILHIDYSLFLKSCRFNSEQLTQIKNLQTIIQNDFKSILTLY